MRNKASEQPPTSTNPTISPAMSQQTTNLQISNQLVNQLKASSPSLDILDIPNRKYSREFILSIYKDDLLFPAAFDNLDQVTHRIVVDPLANVALNVQERKLLTMNNANPDPRKVYLPPGRGAAGAGKYRGGGIAGRQYGADRNFKDEIKSPTENEPWDIPTTITGSFGSNGVFGFDAGSKNDIELEKLKIGSPKRDSSVGSLLQTASDSSLPSRNPDESVHPHLNRSAHNSPAGIDPIASGRIKFNEKKEIPFDPFKDIADVDDRFAFPLDVKPSAFPSPHIQPNPADIHQSFLHQQQSPQQRHQQQHVPLHQRLPLHQQAQPMRPPPGVQWPNQQQQPFLQNNPSPPKMRPFEPPTWRYRDPSGNIQGPFSAKEMQDWFKAGFFETNLPLLKKDSVSFDLLANLIARFGSDKPFINDLRESELAYMQEYQRFIAQQDNHQMFGVPSPQQQQAQFRMPSSRLWEEKLQVGEHRDGWNGSQNQNQFQNQNLPPFAQSPHNPLFSPASASPQVSEPQRMGFASSSLISPASDQNVNRVSRPTSPQNQAMNSLPSPTSSSAWSNIAIGRGSTKEDGRSEYESKLSFDEDEENTVQPPEEPTRIPSPVKTQKKKNKPPQQQREPSPEPPVISPVKSNPSGVTAASPTTPTQQEHAKLSLKEIQQLEDREKRIREKLELQKANNALLEEEAALLQQRQRVNESAVGSASVWGGKASSKEKLPEKTMAEIMKEEEQNAKKRQQRPAVEGLANAGKRYADITGASAGNPGIVRPAVVVASGPPISSAGNWGKPPALSGNAKNDGWDVVGKPNKVVNQQPVPIKKTTQIVSENRINTADESTIIAWCRQALNTIPSFNPTEFVKILLMFNDPNPDEIIRSICDDTLGGFTCIDSRKFADEFLKRRKADRKNNGEDNWSVSAAKSMNFTKPKKAESKGTGMEGFENGNKFVTVKNKKKGKK